MEPIIKIIADKLQLSARQVENIDSMSREGATIPFMSRYRKEATGNLDEVAINNVVDQLGYFSELEKRKETVLKTIESAGHLTDALRKRIADCYDATALEDIYLPYKPKRKTKAAAAMELGLEPLARRIFAQEVLDPIEEARSYLHDKLQDPAQAIQGASHIMAEWMAENEEARNAIRKLFDKSGLLVSKVLNSKKEEEGAQKYRDYFAFSEPLSKCPSHRMLAIRRGEKEGFLLMSVEVDKSVARTELERIFIKANNASSGILRDSIADCVDRLLLPSIESEFSLQARKKAEEEAIQVFAENLRQLLLSAPLGPKRIMAIDPGIRTGCKLACLDDHGTLLHYTTIFPHPPQSQETKSISTLQQLASEYQVDSIAIGSGTAGRETEALIRKIDFGRRIRIFSVNESGASIYSTSELAREEFPDLDCTVRGAISIGRRLMDPLSELVKIDPKSIGVGQYQHDVNQPKLKQALDRIVESCVNYVGVDLNTASRHLLAYVSGLGPTLAKNIVEFRNAHGGFRTREQLREVPLMGPKAFEQSAGFLRIPGAVNPLDASAVHPEAYPLVEAMARDLGSSVATLMADPTLTKKIRKEQYIGEAKGEFTIADILQELQKPGRDPRDSAEEFQFDSNVHSIADLKPGMRLPGIVTNITNFGAFVDIGVKQDGLVHVSMLSNRFVRDPNEVVRLQQRVWVTVVEVDTARNRIALSMQEKGEAPKAAPGGRRTPNPVKKASSSKEATGPSFEEKLADLKRKFRQ